MQQIFTIDAHAAGEPCRVIHAGLPPLPGSTMADRRRALREEFDWVRTGLTHEPRGHSGMFGAVLTPPVRPESAYGLIFFDPVDYMVGCGHGTLCSIAVWRRINGLLAAPFSIDNPDDTVTRVLAVDGDDEHCAIELEMPTATVLADPLVTPGLDGRGPALVHCGNTFLVMAAEGVGVADLQTAGSAVLRQHCLRLRSTAQADIGRVGENGLEVLLYQEVPGTPRTFATFVLFNGSQIDRSPCGTGSAALTSLLLSRGLLQPGEAIQTVGPAGAHFELDGRAYRHSATRFDVCLRGTAHITGVHQWIFSAADSFSRGYLLT